MMDPQEIFQAYKNRRVIDVPHDLFSSPDIDYVLAKFQELKAFEEEAGEEAIIGIWGFPRPHGRPRGHGLYTRSEYDTILTAQERNSRALIFLAPDGHDKYWFERKISGLRELVHS